MNEGHSVGWGMGVCGAMPGSCGGKRPRFLYASFCGKLRNWSSGAILCANWLGQFLTLSLGFGRTFRDEIFPRLVVRLRGTWQCSYVQRSSKNPLPPSNILFGRGAEESAQCSLATLCSTGVCAIRLPCFAPPRPTLRLLFICHFHLF